jgi:hypothetical protein
VDVLDLELAGLDLREVENVVDDRQQMLAGLIDGVGEARCCALSAVWRSSSVMPRMPFIGVRISWLIVARNSLFARLPASARSLALRSSAVRDSTSASSS